VANGHSRRIQAVENNSSKRSEAVLYIVKRIEQPDFIDHQAVSPLLFLRRVTINVVINAIHSIIIIPSPDKYSCHYHCADKRHAAYDHAR
jgi:hypothetical protein